MAAGVYFLANDAILELAIAFLTSVRAHNPGVPLCLIPYNTDIRDLATLRRQFDFSIYDNQAVLARCDQISVSFHRKPYGHYRKLAAWEGPFDKFVYIDADTVVLQRVDCIFPLLDRFDFLVSHSHVPEQQRWVWKPSVHISGKLTGEQIAFSANTGFFASRLDVLSILEAERCLPEALELAPHMELLCMEQPFLNYLMVTSGRRLSSLRSIRQRFQVDIPLACWAGEPGGKAVNGRFEGPVDNPVLLVHWAGLWRSLAQNQAEQMPLLDLWKFYRYGASVNSVRESTA